VHCAALVKTLLESELFGHEKGAFTGADKTRIGRFEIANGGTLFLDEVGEISEEIQVKLLRVLQERKIQRVGGNQQMPVDVRLVVATNRNLESMVREKSFREDLYFRINVISIHIPPLRERKADIPTLARHFVEKFSRDLEKKAQLSDAAIEHLSFYDWPGNIRELENIIERAVILTQGSIIESEDLHLSLESMTAAETIDTSTLTTVGPTIRTQVLEKDMQELAEILTKAKGNVSEAARVLGIPRTTLFHRLKKHHLV
jgi:transcriptional regulator with GAF, ATPase, and Fis domain